MKIFGYEIDKKGLRKLEQKGSIFDGFTPIQQQLIMGQVGSDDIGIRASQNIWVYARCIQMIYDDVAALPYQVQDNDGGMLEDEKFDKFMLNPNPTETGQELIRSMVAYYLTLGNGFIWKNFGGLSTDYYTLQGQSVEIIGDKQIIENISSYKYTNNGKSVVYNTDDILHMKSFNPNSRISGQSRLTAAASEVGLLKRMDQYQKSVLDNGGKPSGHLSTNDIMSDDEFNTMKRRWKEQQGGVNNAGETLITEKGLDYKSIAFNPTDLGILKSETMNYSYLATLMGVPIELLGALAEKKNVSNYEASSKAYMKNTVLPIGNMVATLLNRDFYQDNGNKKPDKKIVIPKELIDELKPSNEDLSKQYWTSPDQKLAMQGFKKSDNPLMENVYIPSNLVNINDLNDLTDDNSEE